MVCAALVVPESRVVEKVVDIAEHVVEVDLVLPSVSVTASGSVDHVDLVLPHPPEGEPELAPPAYRHRQVG